MTTIERVKRDGALSALKDRIQALKFELTNRNWDEVYGEGVFVRLGDAIYDGQRILDQMKETLDALKEMDGRHR